MQAVRFCDKQMTDNGCRGSGRQPTPVRWRKSTPAHRTSPQKDGSALAFQWGSEEPWFKQASLNRHGGSVLIASVGKGRFDLRRRGNSKQLLEPSSDLGTSFIRLLCRAKTALSYRCVQFS